MITGRCYCGATTLTAGAPLTAAWWHCADCRRWTGAPAAAFAAFDSVTLTPDPGPRSAVEGVQRWNCPACGSPMAACFDYLPGQTYVPLGVLDQAGEVVPEVHAHAASRLTWLHIADDLPRSDATARAALAAASTPCSGGTP
ncbi:MAG: GFA family protein [Pseudomonadota bacterium]